jgi:hypothetical protein
MIPSFRPDAARYNSLWVHGRYRFKILADRPSRPICRSRDVAKGRHRLTRGGKGQVTTLRPIVGNEIVTEKNLASIHLSLVFIVLGVLAIGSTSSVRDGSVAVEKGRALVTHCREHCHSSRCQSTRPGPLVSPCDQRRVRQPGPGLTL